MTNIFSDPKLKDDLLALIKRKIEIEQSINSYADDLADIKSGAEKLGLKITELNKIVKHIVNQEAALNELAAIEMIVDNLGEINE